jgi:hypothetical protein
VDQLALPYRIALIAVLAVCALWFVALRPKPETADTAPLPVPAHHTAPGVKGLGTAVDKAKGAVATSDASAKATERAADAASRGTLSSRPATSAAAQPAAKPAAKPALARPATEKAAKPAAATHAKPTSAKPAKPAATPAKPTATPAKPAPAAAAQPRSTAVTDRSAPILAALAQGKVAVVLFLDAQAADDRAVRSAVKEAAKGRAKLITRIAPITAVGDYGAITQGVAVAQAPTVLVIGPDKKAQALTGYVDAASISQLISEAR